MTTRIILGDIVADVVFKDIKNAHLSVYPPAGRVHISAPQWMDLDAIRIFAVSKLHWIKQQQQKLQSQERETPREYLERESHYVWGRRYLLTIIEKDAPPRIELKHGHLLLQVRPGATEQQRRALIEGWYREQIKQAVPTLLVRWEPRLGVHVERFFIRRMKTRWGSCNHQSHTIRLNTELAKKPRECLEYVVVHELTHMLEPTHRSRFKSLLDSIMPSWQLHRMQLNQLPVRNEEWSAK